MFSEALQIYKSLDDEQKAFVREKKIEKNYRIKRWLEFFEKVAEMDMRSDAFRDKSFKYLIGLGVVGFLLLILGSGFLPGLILLAALSIVFSFLLWLFFQHKKIDLENHFRLTIVPLLSILKEEIDNDTKLYVAVDCSDQMAKEKVQRVVEPESKTMPYFTATYYKNPWFYIEGTMKDGTYISMNFEDLIRKKDITKRGSRGKVKTKNKFKIVHKIKITMHFSKATYHSRGSHNKVQDMGDYYEYTGLEKVVSTDTEEQIDLNFPLLGIAKGYNRFRRNETA